MTAPGLNIGDMDARIQALSEQEAKVELDEITKEHNALKETHKTTVEQLKQSTEARDAIQKERDAALTKIANIEAESKNLLASIKKKEEANAKLARELEQSEDISRQHKQMYDGSRTEIGALEDDLRDIKAELDKYTGERTASNLQRLEFEGKISELESQSQAITKLYGESLSQITDQRNKLIKANNENTRLTNELNRLKSTLPPIGDSKGVPGSVPTGLEPLEGDDEISFRPNARISDLFPKRFSGAKDQDPRSHIYSFMDYCEIQGIVTDAAMIKRFKNTLENKARLWMQSLDVKTFDELREQFIRQYTGVTTHIANVMRFRQVVYTYPESLETYKQRLLLLAQTIGYDVREGKVSPEVLTQYRLGLPKEVRKFMTTLPKTATIKAMEVLAQEHIDIEYTDTGIKNPTQVTFGETDPQTALLGKKDETLSHDIDNKKEKEQATTDQRIESLCQKLGQALVSVEQSKVNFDRSRTRSKSFDRNRSNSYRKARTPTRDNYFRRNSRSRSRDRYQTAHLSRRTDYSKNSSSRNSYNRDRSYSRDGYRTPSRGNYRSNERYSSNTSYGRSNSRENDARRTRDVTPYYPRQANDRDRCYYCKENGHFFRNCPNLWKGMSNEQKPQNFLKGSA